MSRSVARVPWIVVLAVVLYGVASWVLYRPLGLLDSSRLTLGNDGNDVFQQVWLLGLAHSEIVRGHLSFFTQVIDHGQGVNLLDSASMPILAVAMSPFTGLFGPIAAYGLLLRIALLASSTSCMLCLRRVIASDLAAAVGGAVYGFAPYMSHQASVHAFLVFVPLPPVMALIVYRRLSGQRGRPLRGGLVLGLVAVVQYLIDSEILVSVVLMIGLTVIVFGILALRHPRLLLARLRILVLLLVGTAIVAVPLLAYPAWFALDGPRHISGPVLGIGRAAINPKAWIRAPYYGLLTSPSRVTSVDFGDQAFLGVTLIVVLAAIIVVNWRTPLVRVMTVMGAIALVLSIGPILTIGHSRVEMPFSWLQQAPVVRDVAASRLAFYVDSAVAVLVAVGVAWCTARFTRRGWWMAGLGLAGILAGLAFLVPVGRFATTRPTTADAFSTRAVRVIPVGAVAVTYPQPGFASSEAMAWQAESRMRFDLLGGYAVHPMASGGFTRNPPLARVHEIAAFLGQLRSPWSPVIVRASLPAFVHDSGVSVALVARHAHGARRVVRILSALYGPPGRIGAVDVWTDLGTEILTLHHTGPSNPLFPGGSHSVPGGRDRGR